MHINWHKTHLQSRTISERIADSITLFVGSWSFLLLHTVWFAAWILLHIEPFPFGLLTMIVSLEAIFLSTFVMISQNRQADRDRYQSQADFEINKHADQRIEELHQKLDNLTLGKPH